MADNNTDTHETRFVIPAARMGYLETRIGELQARAVKLAFAVAIGFTVLREFIITEDRVCSATGKHFEVKHPMVEVEVFGEAPRFEGWTLLGRLDFVSIPGGVMRAMVPGEECPAEFHDVASTRCDACNAARQRNDTFMLRHEDGRTVVVGRSCIRDYLGHVSPEHIANLAQFLNELATFGPDEDGYFGGSREVQAWDIVEVLAYAAHSIRKYGWAPTRDERSTKDATFDLLTPPGFGATPEERRAWKDARKAVTASDYKHAENAIAWLAAQTPDSDYMHNLCAIIEAGVATYKSMGIAVSGILCFDRAMERETNRRKVTDEDAGSEYVGSVKKRQDWKATVKNIRIWDGDWGTTTFIKMHDADGNVLVWKASNAPEVYVGDVLTFKGTVKEHSAYKGTKQTILSRCAKLVVVTGGPNRAEEATA